MRNLPPLTMAKKRGRPRKTDPTFQAKRRKVIEDRDLGSASESLEENNRRVTRSQAPEVQESEPTTSPFYPSRLTKSEIECVVERLIPTKSHVLGTYSGNVPNEDVQKKGITGWGHWADQGRKAIETEEQPLNKKVGKGNYKRKNKKKLVAEELYNNIKGRAVNNEFKRQLLESYADSLQKWAESGFPKRDKRGRKDVRRQKNSLEPCTQSPGSVVLVRNFEVNASREWFPAVLISRSCGFSQLSTACEETKQLDTTHGDEGSRSTSSLGSFSLPIVKPSNKREKSGLGCRRTRSNSWSDIASLEHPDSVAKSQQSQGNHEGTTTQLTITDREKHEFLVRSFGDDNYHLVSPSRLKKFYTPGMDSDCEAEALVKALLFAQYSEIPDSWENDVLASVPQV